MNANDGRLTHVSGYTNVEVYLNSLVPEPASLGAAAVLATSLLQRHRPRRAGRV